MVEVDLVVSEMDRANPRAFVDVESQGAIEGDHCFRVPHRDGDVIEPADATAGLLCASAAGSASEETRDDKGADSRFGELSDESAS